MMTMMIGVDDDDGDDDGVDDGDGDGDGDDSGYKPNHSHHRPHLRNISDRLTASPATIPALIWPVRHKMILLSEEKRDYD